MTTALTPELIQANLQRLVSESGLGFYALSAVSGVARGDLRHKLTLTGCHFTVEELLRITLALGYGMEALFEPIEPPREIRRSTEPGEPDQHGIGGGL